jgi:hypothetical protein
MKYKGFDIKRQKRTSESTPIIIPELRRCAWSIHDAKVIIDKHIKYGFESIINTTESGG